MLKIIEKMILSIKKPVKITFLFNLEACLKNFISVKDVFSNDFFIHKI